MRRALLALLLAATAACSGQPGEGSQDLCGLASAHLAACLGKPIPAVAGACEGDAADLAGQALTTSCAELKADDKGDGQSGGLATLVCISLGAPVFAHGLQEDEACCFDYNCEGALVCRRFRCVKKSDEGGPCERANHCAGDLGCFEDHCEARSDEGGACDRNASCEVGLLCDGGRCVPPAPDGGACSGDLGCASRHCLAGRCVTPSPEGGVCGGTAGICDADLECVSGACREPAASGAACERDDFFACDMGETCWDGACVRRHGEGEACENMFDCKFSLFCQHNVCLP